MYISSFTVIDILEACKRINSSTLPSFSLGNTHPRGEGYERLAKYYLLHSPLWKVEMKEVWLWSDRLNPLNPPSSPHHDFGIDLVAQDFDGSYWSAQVKERATISSPISWGEISKFAGASEILHIPPRHRILFLFNSSLSSTAFQNTKEYKVITESDMEREDLDYSPFFNALEGGEEKKLRPYQTDAVEKCLEGFEKEDKGQLIMACGTGKTITGLSIAEEMAKKKDGSFFSLCLLPSIQLLSQTLVYWHKMSSLDFSAQAICSDTGAAEDEEDSPSYLQNVPRVAKTPEDILAPTKEGMTSLFCTYPSLPKVIEAQKMGRIPVFDLCIADEAHRTTSKNLWGKIHFGGLKAKKTLFMTATPRLKDPKEGPSMDNPSFFGRVFFKYSFEKAIKEGWLSNYRVLLYAIRGGKREDELAGKILASFDSFFTNPKDFQTVFGLEKVKVLSIPLSSSFKEPYVSKAIFFCRSIEESKKVANHFEEVLRGRGLPESRVEVRHIDGEDRAKVKLEKLRWLNEGEEGKVRVLSNSRCLTEGVDVPSLEAVVFFDPKNSNVDVTQAVGRVIRTSENKPFGLVVVPVVLGENETVEEAEKHGKYEGFINLLKELRCMDPALDLALSTEPRRGQRKERQGEENATSMEGLGEILGKQIREEIPPSPIRFSFSRAQNLLDSFKEGNPKEWEKAKDKFPFWNEERFKEEVCLHFLLSPFFPSLGDDLFFSSMEHLSTKAFPKEEEERLRNPVRKMKEKFSSFLLFFSSFLEEALGEEEGEKERPSVVPPELRSLLTSLERRVEKEEGVHPNGLLFDPFMGDGSLLSFFKEEGEEKRTEGRESRLIPYYRATEMKKFPTSLGASLSSEQPSLVVSNLLNFPPLKESVEGGGRGEKEIEDIFRKTGKNLKKEGMALFLSPTSALYDGPMRAIRENFSALYALNLKGSNGIRQEGAGENVMSERSSVTLLCCIKSDGTFKGKMMEVKKNLSRKEKLGEAEKLLREGGWEETNNHTKGKATSSSWNNPELPNINGRNDLAQAIANLNLNLGITNNVDAWNSTFANKRFNGAVLQQVLIPEGVKEGKSGTELLIYIANRIANAPRHSMHSLLTGEPVVQTTTNNNPSNKGTHKTRNSKKSPVVVTYYGTRHFGELMVQKEVLENQLNKAKEAEAFLNGTNTSLSDAINSQLEEVNNQIDIEKDKLAELDTLNEIVKEEEEDCNNQLQEVQRVALAKLHKREEIQKLYKELQDLQQDEYNAKNALHKANQNLQEARAEVQKIDKSEFGYYNPVTKEFTGTELVVTTFNKVMDAMAEKAGKYEEEHSKEAGGEQPKEANTQTKEAMTKAIWAKKERFDQLANAKESMEKAGIKFEGEPAKEFANLVREYQAWERLNK